MVPGKPLNHNSYRGELVVQLGVMCEIETMEYVLGSTTLMFNSCNNMSALRRASIHSESVKPQWKQSDFISCLSDAYQSINSGVSLVQMYGHQNSGNPASTLTPLASLNVILDKVEEHFMVSFLLSSATRNTIAVVLLDPYGLPIVST